MQVGADKTAIGIAGAVCLAGVVLLEVSVECADEHDERRQRETKR